MRILKITLRYALMLGGLGIAAPAFAASSTVPWDTLHWSAEPAVLVPIVLTTVWYLVGFARLRQLRSAAPLYGPRQLLCYLGGQATLVLALLSPLDALADQLFSAHMLEHMLLMMLAAPLLVWGRPAPAFLWAFGPVGRKRVGAAWRSLGLTSGVNGLMHPVLVWVLFCGVFITWHLPGPYQLALRNENVHTLEHASFLLTALMFWTIVIEPSGRRRLTYGATLLFILAATVVSSLPGAIITLAGTPLYPYYSGTARWGLSVIEDQQLAGILMWLPGGVAYLIASGGVLLRWLEFDDSRRPALKRQSARRAKMVAASVEHAEAGAAAGSSLAHPLGGRASSLALLLSACSILLLGLSGCGSSRVGPMESTVGAAIGNPNRGATLIQAEGCGSCHEVPGINDANGLVGPPLTQMGRRIYIAGVLRNTPDNMIEWLRSPQSIVPGNAMPDMGLTDVDARDITAYLYTLR